MIQYSMHIIITIHIHITMTLILPTAVVTAARGTPTLGEGGRMRKGVRQLAKGGLAAGSYN